MTGGGLRTKLGALLVKDSLRGMKDSLDYSSAGGAVLFGVKAPVIKAHGSSDSRAIYHTIKQTRKMLATEVVAQLVTTFEAREN